MSSLNLVIWFSTPRNSISLERRKMGQRKLDELSETQPCISLRGRSLRHMTYLSTLLLLISLKRLKIQTSNFAFILMIKNTKPKNIKTDHEGAWFRSHDLVFEFWDPLISQKRLKLKTANCAYSLRVRDTIQ